VREAFFSAASMPRVHHLTGEALFPGRLFLVASHLSCDASSIGGTVEDFSRFASEIAFPRFAWGRG
jgi:hypothetical protein